MSDGTAAPNAAAPEGEGLRSSLPVKESRRSRLKREQAQGTDNSGITSANAQKLVADALIDGMDLTDDDGKKVEPPPADKKTEPAPDGEPQPRTLKDIASALEVKPAELYATKIPMGEPFEDMTLGELKDYYRANHGNFARLADVDRTEMQLRLERSQAVRDLDQLVSLLPPQAVSAEYREAVRQQAGRMAQIETQRLVAAAPDLQDPAVFHEAHTNMVETAAGYGLSASDVANIVDHRWILALRDLATYRALAGKAASAKPDPKMRESAPNATTTQKAADLKQQAAQRAAKGGTRDQKISAVAQLLTPKK